MTRLLGLYHATISARTGEALDRSLELWWADRQRELAALRARPEGEVRDVEGCCGRQTVVQCPLWLPKHACAPERLVLGKPEVEVRKEADCLVAFLTMAVSEREEASALPPHSPRKALETPGLGSAGLGGRREESGRTS